MTKRIILTVLALLLVIGGLGGIKFLQISTLIAAGAGMVPPPDAVTTAEAKEDQWEPAVLAIGSLAAVQGLTVAAELDGKIVKIAFEPGSTVKAGDLLIQQDTSVEEAQLRSAESSAALAKINLDRSRDLLAKTTISQSDYDTAEANYRQTAAQADNYRATIAKKTIRAPFAGRLGIRLVNLGQTLKAADSIVSLQALDPVYANFLLPQQRLSVLAVGQTVRVTTDAIPDKLFEGKINTINPDVDSATRNVRVQATFANSDEALRPGMYVNIAVVLPTKNTVITIPATAILYATYGNSVFIVEDKKNEKTGAMEKVVRQQFVRLGETRGDYVAVESGLKPHDVVVSTGAFKLHNGGAVIVNNSLAPETSLTPKPKDT